MIVYDLGKILVSHFRVRQTFRSTRQNENTIHYKLRCSSENLSWRSLKKEPFVWLKSFVSKPRSFATIVGVARAGFTVQYNVSYYFVIKHTEKKTCYFQELCVKLREKIVARTYAIYRTIKLLISRIFFFCVFIL